MWMIGSRFVWRNFHVEVPFTGVQGKNNAYHNVSKVQSSFINALILNLIDIVVCVVFALYSSSLNPPGSALVTREQKLEFLKCSGHTEELLYRYFQSSPELRFLSAENSGNKG